MKRWYKCCSSILPLVQFFFLNQYKISHALRFLACLVRFLHINYLLWYNLILVNLSCTRFKHFILVQSHCLITIVHVHICWPQTTNMDSSHIMADSRSEKYHISAQNKAKYVLATSIFRNLLEDHGPRPPPSGVTYSASQTTATPSKISLFANKSTWELWCMKF